MEIMGFSIDELKILENLLQASTNVSNIIDYLCELEINNQKDSEKYQKYLLELTREINIENEQYKEAQLTDQQCYKFAKLLSSKANIPLIENKPSTSINNYSNRTIKRVINILVIMMQQSQDFHKNIIPKEFIEEITNLDLKITQSDFQKGIEHSIKIQSALETDIHSMFLSVLENAITLKEYQKYHKNLIKTKYCFSTTNKELESLILECHFSIPSTIYISSRIINELLKESEISYDIIRFAKLKAKAQLEISKLLKLKDSEYSNPTTYIDSIISSCYLRALLSLMTDNEINDFNQEFHDFIDKPEYLKEHLYDRISENIIINCFKCIKYDKRKIRILSTKSK